MTESGALMIKILDLVAEAGVNHACAICTYHGFFQVWPTDNANLDSGTPSGGFTTSPFIYDHGK